MPRSIEIENILTLPSQTELTPKIKTEEEPSVEALGGVREIMMAKRLTISDASWMAYI